MIYYSNCDQYPYLIYPSESVLKKVNGYADTLNQDNLVLFFQKLAKKCIKLGLSEEVFLDHISKKYNTPYDSAFNAPYRDLSLFGTLNRLRYECDLLSLQNVQHKVYKYDKYISDSNQFEGVVKDLVKFGKKSIVGSTEASGKSTAFRNVILPVIEAKRKEDKRQSAIMYVAPLTGIVKQQYEYLKDLGFEMCAGSNERKGILSDNECKSANSINLESRKVITTFKQTGMLFNRYIEKGITPVVYIDEVHAVIDAISYQHDNHYFADIFSNSQSIVMGVSATPQYRMFQDYLGVDNIAVMQRRCIAEEDKFPLSVTVSGSDDTSANLAYRKAIEAANQGKRALVINSDRERNEGFANAANSKGIPADYCHAERKNIDDFHSIRKDGRLQSQLLFSTTVIKEGYDIYGIDTIVNLNKTSGKDWTMARQSLRRGRDAENMHLFMSQKYTTTRQKAVDYSWVNSKIETIKERTKEINTALEAIENIAFAKEFREQVLKNSFHEIQKGLNDQYSQYIRYKKGRAEVNIIAILCKANEAYKATLGHEDILNIAHNDESYNISHYHQHFAEETFDNSEIENAMQKKEENTKEVWSNTYQVGEKKLKGYDIIASIIYFESNKEALRKELAYRFDYIAELEARRYNHMPEELWEVSNKIKECYSNAYAIKLVKRYCRVKASTANVATEKFMNELVLSETDHEFSTHIKRINYLRGKETLKIAKGSKMFITAMTLGSDHKKTFFDAELCKRIQQMFNNHQREEKYTVAYDFYKVYEQLAKEMKYSPFDTENLTTAHQKATKAALYIKPFFYIESSKIRVPVERGGGASKVLQRCEVDTIEKKNPTLLQQTKPVKVITTLKTASYRKEYKPIFEEMNKKVKFHFLNFEEKKTRHLRKKEAEKMAKELECLFA